MKNFLKCCGVTLYVFIVVSMVGASLDYFIKDGNYIFTIGSLVVLGVNVYVCSRIIKNITNEF